MLERAKIRCPVCRSSMPAAVVWAAGDVCPRCGSAMRVERPRTSGLPAPSSPRSAHAVDANSEARGGRLPTAGHPAGPDWERRS
jgi:hypothetical protein